MSKLSKLVLIATFVLCLSMLISSVTAADLNVNSNTSHREISDWMNNGSTVKGNNLIFNVSSYELSDTLLVSKSINIKSNKKTQINFNQNKNMFNVSANEISFSGLILNHKGKGVYKEPNSVIFAPVPSKTITIKDTSINLQNDYCVGVSIGNGKFNFINSHIKGNGIYNYGIVSDTLNVNFQKSSIIFNKNYGSGLYIFSKLAGDLTNTKIALQSFSMGIFAPEWAGNFINSNMTGKSESYGISVDKWNGKITGSKISLNGANSVGIFSKNSKGSISKSKLDVKNGMGAFVSKNVKVSGTSAISKKGQPGIYYYGPRMAPLKVTSYLKSKSYNFKIWNIGESASKTSYLRITVGKYKKTVKVKGIKAGAITTVKVSLPKKYSNTKYKKAAKMIFYNSAGKKESSKALYFKF